MELKNNYVDQRCDVTALNLLQKEIFEITEAHKVDDVLMKSITKRG